MAFHPELKTITTLAANQLVTSSVVPVDVTGFSFAVGAAKQIFWEVDALFTLGATGGFRFLAHNTAAPTTYNAEIWVRDSLTPTTFTSAQTAEAAFANASAVATTYILRARGYVLANAATTFSFQFAQNTADVLSITMLAGATMRLTQY